MTAIQKETTNPSSEVISINENALAPFDREMSPITMKAIQAIQTGRIPADQISSHPGKGGKVYKYVKHTHATRLMNDAFGEGWDWEVLNPQVYADGTVTVLGRMTIHIPYKGKDGEILFYNRVIQEVGAFEAVGGTMAVAMRVSSAGSRALLKCMFRAFGFGRELYPDQDEEITTRDAWNTILQYANKNKLTQAEIMARFRKDGIFTSEGKLTEEEQTYFLTKFEKLWSTVRDMVEEKRGLAPVPEE